MENDVKCMCEKKREGSGKGEKAENASRREKERGKIATRTSICNRCLLCLGCSLKAFTQGGRSKSYLVPANIYTVIQLASPLITRQRTLMRLLILFHVARFCISLFKHAHEVPISRFTPSTDECTSCWYV